MPVKHFVTSSQCPKDTGILDYHEINCSLGGAGMVVATRIANASRSSQILLLEVGGEPSVLNEIPAFDAYLENQPANTWLYNSTEQTNACRNCDGKVSVNFLGFMLQTFASINDLKSMFTQKVLTTRGKMLGGSTSTNFMMYGDTQWNYENLLSYFKKSEDYNGAWASQPDALTYHGKGGLRNVGTYDFQPGVDEFLAAALEKGYILGDYNGANQEGNYFQRLMSQLKTAGERVHTALSTETRGSEQPLHKKYARVTKINFLTLLGHQKLYNVNVVRDCDRNQRGYPQRWNFRFCSVVDDIRRRPAEHLSSLNIPLVKDLPVGKQLSDHVTTLVALSEISRVNPNRDLTIQAATEFLTSPTMLIYKWSTLQHLFIPSYPRPEQNVWTRVDILESWFDPTTNKIFGLLILGRPKSVGELRLASTNPYDNPIMDLQYLQHPDDVEAMLHGFKIFVDLYENTAALDNTKLFEKPVPGCDQNFKSDDYYRCVIRSFSFSIYHHVGTCALGKVVDGRLNFKYLINSFFQCRVIGIDGLRVIDASVMPRLPNGNTQAATIMIAEKGSDLIIADM
ncbi:Glucose dehydrogenase [FAD, quinone] [Orchesella cincta]|uniref:Glucose dehydrogenase [FAD, quinone] n=1 Tax=Orchesella cincta TaxID=48709 RepID=A0A1D2M3K5_ORCCI|nr:Glucose dehydrogenase [FAD, quinone] [Orchesella cincta]